MTQLRLDGTGPALDPELGQFHTPQPLANKIAAWAINRWVARDLARIPPDVIEPSAGGGNIVAGCLASPTPCGRITAIELDPRWCDAMRQRFAGEPRVEVRAGDFLAEDPAPFACLGITNPPWDGAAYTTHIAELLKQCLYVVAITPAAFLFGKENHRVIWARYKLTGVVYLSGRPAFLGDGGKQDVVITEITRYSTDRATQEWWAP